jgi:hypothetical protein
MDLREIEVSGASTGNIMAAIIRARKPQSPSPIVPGLVDMRP